MEIVIVIPARLKSTRLPNKPLIDILGKTLVQRTYERCIMVFPKEKVYVATDSTKIEAHCIKEGMQVVLTSSSCLTGTDRIADFAKKIKADYYVNVQGDEPLANPDDIKLILNSINRYPNQILNGYCPIVDKEDLFNVNIPKVVASSMGKLFYMSRSNIPGNKKNKFVKGWRQVCIYAFPYKALIDFASLANKTEIEEIEDIEILRFLELGYDVQMLKMSDESVAVDTDADLLKVIEKIKNEQISL